MGEETEMTASQHQQQATAPPKKRFIGKAKAEALRRQTLLQKERQDGISIEDGVLALKGTPILQFRLVADHQGHLREAE